MEGLASKNRFKFEAVVAFYRSEEDDFRPRIYYSTKGEEKRVIFEIYLSKCGIYFPIDIDLNNPVEVGLLEEFKALCRKSIRWRYYRYGVNWFDRLVKEADEIYTRKDLDRLVRELRGKDALEVAFGEKEVRKYVFTTGILFAFERKKGFKVRR